MNNKQKKIQVLIVDDSLLYREFLAQGLAADPMIQVVGTAADVYAARDKIEELEPDVLTLDVEMPRMNGINFLKKLMPQYPLPVVMVSGLADKILEAMKCGAVDFVLKPGNKGAGELEKFIKEVIVKVKLASTARVQSKYSGRMQKSGARKYNRSPIIAIGASTGGTEAIEKILQVLPPNIPGIVIVQHMPPMFTDMYARRLNDTCQIAVKEAVSGDKIVPGRALIAAGNLHMVVKCRGNEYSVECFQGHKISGHCPSVDVLFHSVAQQAQQNAIGIILTGMGGDGAKGLLAMRKAGARTIGQSETSCVVYGMPKVAAEIGAVETQVNLEAIPQKLISLVY